MTTMRGGSGLSGITRDGGERPATSAGRRAGTGRAPGSVLIAVAAWLLTLIGGGALFVSFSAQYAYIVTVRRQDAASVIEALLLDLLMITFTLLALGLSRAGKPARTERILILACAAASSYMNVSAADVASPRSVAAYAIAPVALAVVVDRVVAVIRRHVLADREPSAWSTVGDASAAAARIAGRVLLYCLRFALAAPETARGLRRMVLDATPLPGVPEAPAPEVTGPPRTKKTVLLTLYRAHSDYGDRSRASRVASELAPRAGLQAGTARSYVYAELAGRAS
jgi:signal transduction histidine kinase